MDEKPFVTVTSLAERTGLPVWWLRAEAGAGRIPFLKVGKRMMFNVQAVEAALAGSLSARTAHQQEAASAAG